MNIIESQLIASIWQKKHARNQCCAIREYF